MDSRWARVGKVVLDVATRVARSRVGSGTTAERSRSERSRSERPGPRRTGRITLPRFPAPAADRPVPRPDGPRGEPTRGEVETAVARPEIAYSPVRDGDADPGEVVWAWVPYEEDPSQGKDRPLLVIGHIGDDVGALALTSRDKGDHHQHPIGSGQWDSRGRPSWVKLDRLFRLDPDGIRREGAILDQQRFNAVVAAWEAY